MGSSTSKQGGDVVVGQSSYVRRRRGGCLGGGSTSGCGGYESDEDSGDGGGQDSDKVNRNSRHVTCTNISTGQSVQVNEECYRKQKEKHQPVDEAPSVCSDAELDEWSQESVNGIMSAAASSSIQAAPSRSGRLRSRVIALFSNSLTVSNNEESHINTSSTNSSVSTGANSGDGLSSDEIHFIPMTSELLSQLQNEDVISNHGVARNNGSTVFSFDGNASTSSNHTDQENVETQIHFRQNGDRESVDSSMWFSRTLSVGRLRERVLRRASSPEELLGHLQEEREVMMDYREDSERQLLRYANHGGSRIAQTTCPNVEISLGLPGHIQSMTSNNFYNNQDDSLGTLRTREPRFQDIVEHRTDFLERRRRIRSQVRALQRLGGHYENLSGHERSCILSGQHRTGCCTCRSSVRGRNPDSETSARASISRIVMLAEALFEVLDEIHQQSVVLSSRPSMSSIGSVPAPKEVVESMPVKIHTKSQKCEDDEEAQCYICLLEYEEADNVRVLPCHHEFHLTCIDKWLKEIHRVCPLCRRDVCAPNSLAAET